MGHDAVATALQARIFLNDSNMVWNFKVNNVNNLQISTIIINDTENSMKGFFVKKISRPQFYLI